MKILASFLAISAAWNNGICSKNGHVYDKSGFSCRTKCKFDWIGRNENVQYKEFGKSENGFLAQLSAGKSNLEYLGKDGSYVGMLRFDRTYCKRAILKAIGAGRVNLEIFDRNNENYMTEAQYYEAPADGNTKKEAAFVQFRREGYLSGDLLTKGNDRFFIYMSGIQKDFMPLDPPNDLINYDDYYQCFKNVGLMTMADDGEGFLKNDFTRCAAYQRYGQEPDWTPMHPSDVNILVMPKWLGDSYVIAGDGSTITDVKIDAPSTIYAKWSLHAVVKDRLYLFGGQWQYKRRKIARFVECGSRWKELPLKSNFRYRSESAALTIADGSKALLCFPFASSDGFGSCEIFDGKSVTTTHSSKFSHRNGRLGFYEGKPTTVGSDRSDGSRKVETFSISNGWSSLEDHPLDVFAHTLVGLDNGAMILAGRYSGVTDEISSNDIWMLKNNNWSLVGHLKEDNEYGSAIKIGNFIYIVTGIVGTKDGFPVERIRLEDNEVVETEVIGWPIADDDWDIYKEDPVVFAITSLSSMNC